MELSHVNFSIAVVIDFRKDLLDLLILLDLLSCLQVLIVSRLLMPLFRPVYRVLETQQVVLVGHSIWALSLLLHGGNRVQTAAREFAVDGL